MRYHASKSELSSKEMESNVLEFNLESIPFPPPHENWDTTKETFGKVLTKILEYGPKDRLALVDYYIGLLFLVRSWLETGRWPTKTAEKG